MVLVGSALTVVEVALQFFAPNHLPIEARFSAAAFLLFGVGKPLQTQATAEIYSLRPRFSAFFWAVACATFWYSLLIWIWWARRTPNFPLALLDDRLSIRLYFESTVLAVTAGMANLWFRKRENQG